MWTLRHACQSYNAAKEPGIRHTGKSASTAQQAGRKSPTEYMGLVFCYLGPASLGGYSTSTAMSTFRNFGELSSIDTRALEVQEAEEKVNCFC